MPAPPPLSSRLWCLVLLLLVAESRQGLITDFDVPRAVEAGTDAELHCSFPDAEGGYIVKWWWTPSYGTGTDVKPVLIYQKMHGSPPEHRKNIELKENHTIVLKNLTSNDTGIYGCEVSRNLDLAEDRNKETLTVFSNGTGLQVNITEAEDDPKETILVRCEAHDVSPRPELAISVDGVEIPDLTSEVTGGAGGLFDVWLNATVRGVAYDAAVSCELFYEDRNITHPRYIETVPYTGGAGLSTTETPEDTTHSEVASEFQEPSSVSTLHASFWLLHATTVVLIYGLF